MKLLLLADGNVGKLITNFLIENYPHDLALVVTTKKNEIYSAAEKNKIPVCLFDSEEDIINRLVTDIDLGLLAWWPKILKNPLLKVPQKGFINTHPSLLPHNRGKHYNFWALVEQAPFGVTLHFADEGVDTGDIVAQAKVDYDWRDTGETLYNKAQAAMFDLFCNTYPILRVGSFQSSPQNLKLGSYHRASELDTASKIDLESSYSARALINLLRARTFNGHPGCWFEEGGTRYEITIGIKKVK